LSPIQIAITAVAALLAVAMPGTSRAEANYPSRTVKMIVPYPPGGGTDLLARVLAQQLSEKWKQSVIVENIGGAGGNVGAEQVARAVPDGYTLLFGSPGPLATNALVYKTMPDDPAKWVPIAIVATSPYVLVVSPQFCRIQRRGGDRRRQSQAWPAHRSDAGSWLARPVRHHRIRAARASEAARSPL
jgi:tripartite-type tricarboxylate transporter receptor subunit TctC